MAEAEEVDANPTKFLEIHAPLDCYVEVNRTLKVYQVRSPNDVMLPDLHIRYIRALEDLESASNWHDERSFIGILYFINMPSGVQARTFCRLAVGSFRFLSSNHGRNSNMKRALLSVLVHFFRDINLQHHRVDVLEAACGLVENELELQYDRIMRDKADLVSEDIEDINLVVWAINSFLSTEFAHHASRKKRQRVARLLIAVLLYYPFDCYSRSNMMMRNIKDCLYSIGLYDVVQRHLLYAVSKIAAGEAPRIRAKTIIKLFYKRVVTCGGLSERSAENILMRLCIRLYKLAGDARVAKGVRSISIYILQSYPSLIPQFRQRLSEVWAKYRRYLKKSYQEELAAIFVVQN